MASNLIAPSLDSPPSFLLSGKSVARESDPTADLVLLAQAINSGQLAAEDLENLASVGLRYLRCPARATLEELRSEVHSLRSGFANAVARGELMDLELAGQIEMALEEVDRALTRSCPITEAVVPNLKLASRLLMLCASQKTSSQDQRTPARLAPVAATAWVASVRLFNA